MSFKMFFIFLFLASYIFGFEDKDVDFLTSKLNTSECNKLIINFLGYLDQKFANKCVLFINSLMDPYKNDLHWPKSFVENITIALQTIGRLDLAEMIRLREISDLIMDLQKTRLGIDDNNLKEDLDRVDFGSDPLEYLKAQKVSDQERPSKEIYIYWSLIVVFPVCILLTLFFYLLLLWCIFPSLLKDIQRAAKDAYYSRDA